MISRRLRCSLKLFTTLLVASFAAAPVLAGRQAGSVVYVSADRTFGKGVITFRLAGGAPTEKPSCASADDLRWALNVGSGSTADQYIYSSLLSAMAGGWKVTIVGTGQCSTASWLEDIAYVEVSK